MLLGSLSFQRLADAKLSLAVRMGCELVCEPLLWLRDELESGHLSSEGLEKDQEVKSHHVCTGLVASGRQGHV